MAARYIVRLDDREIEVDIREETGGYVLTLEGEEIRVDDLKIARGSHRSLLIEGRSYEVVTQESRTGTDVYVSGDVIHLQVQHELWARAAGAARGAGTGEEIVSPMPGAVVEISVAPGQKVAAGDTVAVVEAMKMQNDIAATRGGTVTEIRAKAGDVVDPGAVLVILSAGEESDG